MEDCMRRLKRYLVQKLKSYVKSSRSPKKSGYRKLISDEEQRWLDEYAARNSQLPRRIGIPYYD